MILPWASTAQIHSATTRDEFLDWLRYHAIDFGMSPAFIDCVDDLRSCEDAQDEIEELKGELETADDKIEKLKRKLYMAKETRKRLRK